MANNTTTIANPSLVANNESVFIVSNSLKYTEGFGEQNVRVQSAGGGNVAAVVSNNVETNKGNLKFSLMPTPENIRLARSWKANPNINVFSWFQGELERTLPQATVTNDYEVNLAADGTIDLEIMGRPTV